MLSSLEVGRANAYVPEITAGRAAATKMFKLLERESKINPEDPTGITPVRHNPKGYFFFYSKSCPSMTLGCFSLWQDLCGGEVSLSNTNFFYPTRPDIQALSNLNLSAGRGQSIAMVGPSGGGKTTVVQLIERFYEAISGSPVSHLLNNPQLSHSSASANTSVAYFCRILMAGVSKHWIFNGSDPRWHWWHKIQSCSHSAWRRT